MCIASNASGPWCDVLSISFAQFSSWRLQKDNREKGCVLLEIIPNTDATSRKPVAFLFRTREASSILSTM